MSSKKVHNEIVQMAFEARKFRDGVRDAIRQIQDFKKSFDFDEAQESLGALEADSNAVDFAQMSSALDSINSKMSIVGVTAATMISNITNAISNAARSMVDIFVMKPLTSGLEEYETQLNAVQTILANTASKGSTLDDVNDALNELNTYADLTIYNFTEMTKSIGTFTTAGVNLETSTAAIKGIANVAALSGSNANQAATAMYQLSQAISSGSVRLQDWMSIENAGMGGEIFREELMRTAKMHGVHVDNMIAQQGSFRETLKSGWLTSSIMLETLQKFTGDLSDEALRSIGYTEEAIAAIQKQAVMATDAATKVKTLTQLLDTMEEALGSGWSQSWMIIFGDFEEAKTLWGQMAGIFGDLIEASGTARNIMLQQWSDTGGRNAAVLAFFNIVDAGINILKAFTEAIKEVWEPLKGWELTQISFQLLHFSRMILEASTKTGPFKSVVRGIASAIDIVRLVIQAVLSPLWSLVKVLFPLNGGFLLVAGGIGDVIFHFRNMAIATAYFPKMVALIVARIGELVGSFADLTKEFLKLDVVQDVIAWFKDLLTIDWGYTWDKIIELLWYLNDILYQVSVQAGILYDKFRKLNLLDIITKAVSDLVIQVGILVDAFMSLGIVQDIIGWLDEIRKIDPAEVWASLVKVIQDTTTTIQGLIVEGQELLDTFLNSDGFKKLTKDIDDFLEIFRMWWEYIQDREQVIAFFAFIEGLSWDSIKTSIKDMADGVKEFIDNIKNSDTAQKFMAYLDTFDGSGFTSFLDAAKSSAKDLTITVSELEEEVGLLDKISATIGPALAGAFDSVKEGVNTLLDFLIESGDDIDWNKFFALINTGILGAIAFAIHDIASGGFMDVLFGDSWEDIGDNVAGVFGAMEDTLGSFQSNIRADTLQKVAVSIALLAGSFIAVTLVDSTKLLAATGAMSVMVATLFGSAGALKSVKTQDAIKAALAITGLAVAMAIIAVALNLLGELEEEEIGNSLEMMIAALVALVGSVVAMQKIGEAKLHKSVAVIIGLASGLMLLTIAVARLGNMEPAVLINGLLGIGTSLVILTGAIWGLSQIGEANIIQAALTMHVMSAALLTLSLAVQRYGTMDPNELAEGIFAIGVILGGFAVFTNYLQPEGLLQAALGILTMSAAMIVMSGAVFLLGSMDLDTMINGLIGVAAILFMLVYASMHMPAALPGAAAMLVMAFALNGLAIAVGVLGSMDVKTITHGLLALGAIFVVIGVAGLLMAPVVPILLLLGTALLLLGGAAFLLGTGLLFASTGLVAIAGLSAASAAAIGIVLTTVIEKIPELATALGEGFSNFIIAIGEKAPQVSEAFGLLILGMIEATTAVMPKIVDAILGMITGILEAIASKAPDFLQAGWDILIALLQGLANNIADVVEAGHGILTGIMEGIAAGFPELIIAAAEMLLAFLSGLADAIEEYMPEIMIEGNRIGIAFVKGIIKGTLGSYNLLKDAVSDLISKVVEHFKNKWQIRSPSRVMIELAKQVMQGFINGIAARTKATSEALVEFADKAQNGIKPIMNAIGKEIEEAMDFQPVVRPVVDLDAVMAGVGTMNKSFGASSVLARVEYESRQARRRAEQASVGGDDERGTVVYKQYNYSPKALDELTIYRQTKTHVAQLANKAGKA